MTIILKKNNVPTKPGNYVGTDEGFLPPQAVTVYENPEGKLRFWDRLGHSRSVGFFERWSDELGPIQFEGSEMQTPVTERAVERLREFTEKLEAGEIALPTVKESLQVPPPLRQGWFEYEGTTYRVVDDGTPDLVVVPCFRPTGEWFNRIEPDLSPLGITINWHDEPAEGMRSVEGCFMGKANERDEDYYSVRIPGGVPMTGTPVTITYPAPSPPVEIEIKPGQRWKWVNGAGTASEDYEVIVSRCRSDGIKAWHIHCNGELKMCWIPDANDYGETLKDAMTNAELQTWLNEHAVLVPEVG